MSATIHRGDCRELLPTLELVDAVCTDPPYGLGFMGKGWDRGVPGVEFWRAVLDRMKPGAHLVAFGGTRTYHRLACAIEDAGFEIRDSLAWIYGSGFPKSLSVSKAIDAAAGFERGTDYEPNGMNNTHGEGWGGGQTTQSDPPVTPEAKKWDGWGTALKPAAEIVIWATKPYDLTAICGILARSIKEVTCQLRSFAKGAELGSESSPNVSGAGADSALWGAVEGCSTPEDLYELMATSPSGLAKSTALSTAWLWLDTLVEISRHANTFTTETATSLTTDLKILNCSPSPITPAAMLGPATHQNGTDPSALLAGSVFCVAREKLKNIRGPTAPVGATCSEQIVLARKPLEGTVAATVLEHGTGALNINACRIQSDEETGWGGGGSRLHEGGLSREGGKARPVNGRWPANLLHDGSPEAIGQMPAGVDRYFYCAKPTTAEREQGLDHHAKRTAGELTDRKDGSEGLNNPRAGAGRTSNGRANVHVTVKPVALMQWLIRLITPPGGTVLDPFMGSGTTGIAALREGVDFIGIELDQDEQGMCAIARDRIVGDAPLFNQCEVRNG